MSGLTCPRCSWQFAGGQACPRCGLPVPVEMQAPPISPPPASPPPGRSTGLVVTVVVLSLLALGLVVTVVALVTGGDDAPSREASAGSSAESSGGPSGGPSVEPQPSETPEPTEEPSPTEQPRPEPTAGIDTLESGLFCRDLYALGYSYRQAVDYWLAWRMPENMDADKNGIPCETVYPETEVRDVWEGPQPPGSLT